MNAKSRILAVVSAALLLGVTLAPASALDLNLGGINVTGGSGGTGGTGTHIGATVGSTSVNITLGGGANLASAGVGTGGTGVNAIVGSGDGPLLTTSNSNGTTTAMVNLGLGGLSGGPLTMPSTGITDPVGDLLDTANIPGGGNGGGGNGGGGNGNGNGNGGPGGGGLMPPQLASAFGSLGASDQEMLRNRCRTVLLDPARFDPSLAELCRIIARMEMLGLN